MIDARIDGRRIVPLPLPDAEDRSAARIIRGGEWERLASTGRGFRNSFREFGNTYDLAGLVLVPDELLRDALRNTAAHHGRDPHPTPINRDSR